MVAPAASYPGGGNTRAGGGGSAGAPGGPRCSGEGVLGWRCALCSALAPAASEQGLQERRESAELVSAQERGRAPGGLATLSIQGSMWQGTGAWQQRQWEWQAPSTTELAAHGALDARRAPDQPAGRSRTAAADVGAHKDAPASSHCHVARAWLPQTTLTTTASRPAHPSCNLDSAETPSKLSAARLPSQHTRPCPSRNGPPAGDAAHAADGAGGLPPAASR